MLTLLSFGGHQRCIGSVHDPKVFRYGSTPVVIAPREPVDCVLTAKSLLDAAQNVSLVAV